jgi:primase-polymerase (primpol)-like protein
VGDGIGFVLNGDGIVCMDLDHCLVAGRVAAWAAPVLKAVPRTYIEVSPSGEGLHVWGTGRLPRGRVIGVPGGRVELYGSGRYLTVTGQRFRGAPPLLAPLGEFIATL